MSSEIWHVKRLHMDAVYGTILKNFIDSGAQKPGTELTLLLFALNHTSLPYSEWRYGVQDDAMYHNIVLWIGLARKKHPHVCSLDETHLSARQELKLLQLSRLTSCNIRCLMSLYQYKQWMAQFLEIRSIPQDTPKNVKIVAHLNNLMQSREHLQLNAMLVSVTGGTRCECPSIFFTQNMVLFLRVFHFQMKVLVGPDAFDSIRSAADGL